MISEADLKISAQTSLKALQIWSLGTPDVENAVQLQHNLDPDIASLVVACQDLRKNGYREGRASLAQNSILNRHVQAMVEDLTDNSLKIFALLTWHFNADFRVPLPCQLLRFFDEPSKIFEDVCTDIYRRYTTMAESESAKSFKRRVIRLLGLVEYYVVKGKWVLYI
ncbi:hypothetical protein N7530_009786 [Penicillium desertorum]|uniref:Uncharacterized protein n=1 Tax=Penicillium desertorum TaxID=1303715 RepID=A0A9X0BIF6_9EURO|nr:hypothetical protein N7530_009786 [Penicillium desertorum]